MKFENISGAKKRKIKYWYKYYNMKKYFFALKWAWKIVQAREQIKRIENGSLFDNKKDVVILIFFYIKFKSIFDEFYKSMLMQQFYFSVS